MVTQVFLDSQAIQVQVANLAIQVFLASVVTLDSVATQAQVEDLVTRVTQVSLDSAAIAE